MDRHIRHDIPWQGEHVRAMHYRDGTVTDGTHENPTITFTGTVKGTVRDAAHWVAVTADRPLTGDEHRALTGAGARTLTVRDVTNVIIPEHALGKWAFEVLSAPALHLIPSSERSDAWPTVQGPLRLGAQLRREVGA